MSYTLEIQKLLIERNTQSTPNDRMKLTKQAIQLADRNSDVYWGLDLRLELIREEKETSRCIESFPAFSWILDAYDSDPGGFDESEFLWEYKWMLGSSRRNNTISLEQINSITEDYKKRLLRNGYSLRPYYTSKVHLAFSMGKIDEAAQFIAKRDNEVIDDMANCRACEMDDNVELYLRKGEFETAFAIGNEMLTKKVVCSHMPFASYCACCYYLTLAGKFDLAAEYFDKATADLSKIGDDFSQLAEIGDLIYFLTKTNKEAAWNFFEKHANWNIDSEAYLDFLYSCRLLPLLKDEGTRVLQVSSELPWFRKDNTYPIADLYKHFYDKAKILADLFDQRNGTNFLNKELDLVK